MIDVKRSEFIESESALTILGKTYTPVGKEEYWFTRVYTKLKKALISQKTQSQKFSNEMIQQYGKVQPNGKIGLQPDDPEMQNYVEAMEGFGDEIISIDVKKLSLEQLKKASVSMTIDEQSKLEYLIDEDRIDEN